MAAKKKSKRRLVWVLNPEGARKRARQKPRDKGAPPHWLRCEYMAGDIRCIKGDGHTDQHEPPSG